MAQTSVTVHCKSCNHQWEVICPLPMTIPRFGVVVKGACAAGCPSCRAHGRDTLLMGPAPVRRAEETTHA